MIGWGTETRGRKHVRSTCCRSTSMDEWKRREMAPNGWTPRYWSCRDDCSSRSVRLTNLVTKRHKDIKWPSQIKRPERCMWCISNIWRCSFSLGSWKSWQEKWSFRFLSTVCQCSFYPETVTFIVAGGFGDAVWHTHPRLHEQHCEHHEAVVRPGPQWL